MSCLAISRNSYLRICYIFTSQLPASKNNDKYVVIAERISTRLWIRDLFLQCMCIRICRSRSGMSICTHMHAQEPMCHVHWHAKMPSDGGQGRTVILDNGGQRGWCSTMYVFCGVECWMQLTVGDIEKEKAMNSLVGDWGTVTLCD